MTSRNDPPADDLLEYILVPVANEEDAGATARALASYTPARLTVVYVVEKGEGVPDKTPVEQSEGIAEAAFDAFRAEFPEADFEVAYQRDVVDAILDLSENLDVSAIVFRPRGGGRITQFLAGDKSLRLVTEATRPVIALPTE